MLTSGQSVIRTSCGRQLSVDGWRVWPNVQHVFRESPAYNPKPNPTVRGRGESRDSTGPIFIPVAGGRHAAVLDVVSALRRRRQPVESLDSQNLHYS